MVARYKVRRSECIGWLQGKIRRSECIGWLQGKIRRSEFKGYSLQRRFNTTEEMENAAECQF